METRVNRAEVLLENWKELEKKLVEFGGSTGMTRVELLRQQHGFLSAGLMRLGVGAQPHERPQTELLQASLSRLEKQLWPNPIVRFFVRLKERFFDRPARQREFGAMKEQNLAELKKFIGERGFGSLVGRLENGLDYERQRVELDMSGQIDADRVVSLALGLELDASGRYNAVDISAQLLDTLNQEKTVLDVPFRYALDAPMVVNLIQGRSVCVGSEDGGEERWLGIYRDGKSSVGEYGLAKSYEIDQPLRELAGIFGISGLHDERLVAELKKGNQIAFDPGPPFEGKLMVEANAGLKEFLFHDHTGKLLFLEEVVREKQAYHRQMETGSDPVMAEMKLHRGQQEQRGMGI